MHLNDDFEILFKAISQSDGWLYEHMERNQHNGSLWTWSAVEIDRLLRSNHLYKILIFI